MYQRYDDEQKNDGERARDDKTDIEQAVADAGVKGQDDPGKTEESRKARLKGNTA